MSNPLARKNGFWETWIPWLLLGSLLCALGAGWVVGTLEDQLASPYSVAGFSMGILAVLLGCLSLVYSVRKRHTIEQGSMVAWLFSHVVLGGAALFLAFAHVGNRLLHPEISLAWLLLSSFVILVLTGVIWRWIYQAVPKRFQPSIRNYSPHYSMQRVEIKQIEIEKALAGQSDDFQEKVRHWLHHGGNLSFSDPQEQERWERIQSLHAEEEKHSWRVSKQFSVHWLLQGWRLLHIPASVLCVLLLPMHILVSGSKTRFFHTEQSFSSAEECGSCHQEIYEEWTTSMHAFALTSPLTIAQTYADLQHNTLTSDPTTQAVCVNCHGPLAAKIDGSNDPLRPFSQTGVGQEGVNCVVCHQFSPHSSYTNKTGKFARNSAIGSFQEFWSRIHGGREVHSFDRNISASAENMYHSVSYIGSADGNDYHSTSSHFCASCHNVHIDRDKDGRIDATKATASHPSRGDLALQSVYDDWREQGNGQPCMSCHGDHGFHGVDYPLHRDDIIAKTRHHRVQLLRSAIRLSLDTNLSSWGSSTLKATLHNVGVAHSFPSGFAFARQIWLEIKVLRNGRTVYSSGVLDEQQIEEHVYRSTQDLCDAESMGYPIREHMNLPSRCPSQEDGQLLNFQKVLMNADGDEAVMQYALGAPRARKWIAASCTSTFPIPYGESLTCSWTPSGSLKKGDIVKARLRFRNLPPYFLRRLHSLQQEVSLEHYVSKLEIIDMAEIEIEVR